MAALYISKLLIILFFINEAIVVARSTPAERQQIKLPWFTALSGLLIFVPFFFTLDLPAWLGWVAVALQVGGLLLEVTAELQLMRVNSFAISSQGATNIQKRGLYRWLENPIYVGILLQLIGWALWLPVVFVCVVLFFLVIKTMVFKEREYLATQHHITHQGLDSFMWGKRE